MDLITPDWIDLPPNIGALSTTRRGGTSAPPYDDGAGGGGMNFGNHVGDDPEQVGRNRELLRRLLPAEPVWLGQVHGTQVVDAGKAAAGAGPIEADASITTEPGVVCAIQTADCLPVLFCDLAGTVVGAAHAGWRGLAHGVLENTIARMRASGAADIIAWLGPAIGPTRFEVGKDVYDAFVDHDRGASTAFRPREDHPGKYFADIYALARRRLAANGVSRVDGGRLCTMNDTSRFYSYRRDGVTGRMASLIWLK